MEYRCENTNLEGVEYIGRRMIGLLTQMPSLKIKLNVLGLHLQLLQKQGYFKWDINKWKPNDSKINGNPFGLNKYFCNESETCSRDHTK